ncbi:hypothetical protein V6N13_020283 [Hibiscus sabdariffa]|uniref:Uncharacterized protein n=1 Tax=Hibiscus sabdariffa TaxID=183260 RepID=A0ABR2EUW9_9ROSI
MHDDARCLRFSRLEDNRWRWMRGMVSECKGEEKLVMKNDDRWRHKALAKVGESGTGEVSKKVSGTQLVDEFH